MPDISLHKILYVEDEDDIQKVAKISLEKIGGYKLLICSSGEEALTVATDFAPDLLLLDVMMPGMDGPDTLNALRNLSGLEHTPAIFMTAKVQPTEIEHFKSIGAIEVLSKPFEAMKLASQIQSIWDQHFNQTGEN